MAGRRRRARGPGSESGTTKMRLLAEIYEELDRERQAEAKLPIELLQMIVSKLTLGDNIRASAVCKRWLSAAISIRSADKPPPPPPLLMTYRNGFDMYEFYEPSKRKSCLIAQFKFNLDDAQVIYAKEGWVLLQKRSTSRIFFYCPDIPSRSINLPFKDLRNRSVAFSAAPTSRNCILAVIEGVGTTDVAVSTFRMEESTHWTTRTYDIGFPFVCCPWNKLVFSNGLFYCFSLSGSFGIYNPDTLTWAVHPIPQPDSFDSFVTAEHEGDIFAVFTKSSENPKIYKLDHTKRVWSERKSLGGITLFINKVSSFCRRNLGKMRDRVYLPKICYGHCISYSLDQDRYYPRDQCFDWEDTALSTGIWIEPPENFLRYH